jgi:hypothetical protein
MDQREKGERENSYLNGMTQQAALVAGVAVGHRLDGGAAGANEAEKTGKVKD